MKNLIYFVFIGIILSLNLLSCSKKDQCEGIECRNNGTCQDGTCKCPVGYEGNLCETESLPKAVNITSIKCLKIPATKTDGSKWDADGTNPDLYPVLFTLKADNKTADVSIWVSDLIKLNAPVDQQHEFNIILPKLSINPVDKYYALFLFDKEDNGQESMSGISFNMKDLIKGRPSTITLDCSTCKLAFELKVSYEF